MGMSRCMCRFAAVSWVTTCSIASARSVTTSTGTPSPQNPHQVLQRSDVRRKILIIGDIHGCFDELLLLLEKAEVSESTHTVILAGDLINKGPKSAEVVRWAAKRNVLAVRGNHDDALLEYRFFCGRYKDDRPERYSWANDLTDEEVAYVQNMPLSISMPWIQRQIVHAGIVPGKEIEDQEFLDLTKIRTVTLEDGVYHGSETNGGTAWAKVWNGPEHIYFGHDAKRGLQQEAFATGLDTGACYGKYLTGVLVDADGELEDEIVQVKALEQYSIPGNSGMNSPKRPKFS